MTEERRSIHAPYFPRREALAQYLDEMYANGWLTNHGPLVGKLEERLADYLDVPYVVTVANGTLALQLATRLLGLKGEVITTPLSFVATANALQWEGIVPRFVDVCRDNYCLDPERLESAINRATSAILPVHLFGQAADQPAIQAVADRKGLPVVYDAAQAFGLSANGQNVLRYGDISVLSFHATKIFHTVEGGALILHDQVTYERALRYRSHGRVDLNAPPGLGINAKLSELHAAIGHCLLDEMDCIQTYYQELRTRYRGRLGELRGIRWTNDSQVDSSYCAYMPILIEDPSRRALLEERLRELGIQPRRYFDPPLHRLSQFNSSDQCPIADELAQRIVLLPMPAERGLELVDQVCDVIVSVFSPSISCQI